VKHLIMLALFTARLLGLILGLTVDIELPEGMPLAYNAIFSSMCFRGTCFSRPAGLFQTSVP
jgi:hypothetical protein